MGLTHLLAQNPLLFVMVAVGLLYSIIAHEVAHGWVALLFGDDTALRHGRLTWNPLPHLDIVGALMLFFVGFGWAKPVPVNYAALKNSRFGIIAVALAGCVTNILIAFVAMAALQFDTVAAKPAIASLLMTLARINIILGAFNLIPIPPLDGSRILMALLPPEAQRSVARIEPYGFFILILFLFTGLLNPVIAFMQNAIYGLISLVVGLAR
jgi:Zn-dependent protease